MAGGPEITGNLDKKNEMPDYLRAENKLDGSVKRNQPVDRPNMESILREGYSKEGFSLQTDTDLLITKSGNKPEKQAELRNRSSLAQSVLLDQIRNTETIKNPEVRKQEVEKALKAYSTEMWKIRGEALAPAAKTDSDAMLRQSEVQKKEYASILRSFSEKIDKLFGDKQRAEVQKAKLKNPEWSVAEGIDKARDFLRSQWDALFPSKEKPKSSSNKPNTAPSAKEEFARTIGSGVNKKS